MGEIVLRQRLKAAGRTDLQVSSAGTSDEEHGHGLDRRAARVLNEAGYPLPSHHRAHRATARELQEADLVLAMTTGHARLLKNMMKQAGTELEKLHLWREFDGTLPVAPAGVFGPGGAMDEGSIVSSRGSRGSSRYSDQYSSDGVYDVPDPWYGSQDGFYRTLAVVEAGVEGILAWLEAASD